MEKERYKIKKIESGTETVKNMFIDIFVSLLPISIYAQEGKSWLLLPLLALGVASMADLVEYIEVFTDKYYEKNKLLDNSIKK